MASDVRPARPPVIARGSRRVAARRAAATNEGFPSPASHRMAQLLTDIQNVFERVYPTPKILILNFPHNPTAKIVTLDFYEEAVAMAKHFKFWLINDFAYGHTCFDGYKAPSILQVKGAKDVAVETFTMSKPYNMAGWRLGFMAGNAQLVELLGRVKQYFDYGHFRCVQVAAAVALEKGDEAIRKQADIYRRRRDVFLKGLQDAGWGRTIKNRATMFTWQPLPEACKDMGSMEFAMQVAEKVGVSFLPGAGFGEAGEGYLRMALVEPEDRLREACRRVKKFLKG
jgi:alanine-synthesizing transaminase